MELLLFRHRLPGRNWQKAERLPAQTTNWHRTCCIKPDGENSVAISGGLMLESASQSEGMAHKHLVVYAAILAIGGACGAYAIHEHRTAENLAANNVQTTAALDSTRHELSDLTAKVNSLASRN